MPNAQIGAKIILVLERAGLAFGVPPLGGAGKSQAETA